MVDPRGWPQDRHTQSCDVDSGTREIRLNSSCLFYFCKFSFVVDTKYLFPAFCMNTKLNLQRQIKRDKPSLKSRVPESRHNSFQTRGRLVRLVDPNGGKLKKSVLSENRGRRSLKSWHPRSYDGTILTTYIYAVPRTCRGFSRGCCHVAWWNDES